MSMDWVLRGTTKPAKAIFRRLVLADDWSRRPAVTLDGLSDRYLSDPKVLLQLVDTRLAMHKRCGSVGYVELWTSECQESIEAFVAKHLPKLIETIDRALGRRGVFCWYAGRFIVVTDHLSVAATRAVFEDISREIVGRTWHFRGHDVHATPIVGYSDLILTSNARELWEAVESALDRAKFSLEVKPVRYRRHMSQPARMSSRFAPAMLWRAAPPMVVLVVQFFASLLFGLGLPFIMYSVCDALGYDISGPVYVGVVVVLVITSTTIWIEGLLALRSTTPPAEPGSAYPPATIIIPAYLPNEAATIIETLQAFLKLDYANSVQIIVAYNCPQPHMPVEDELAELAALHAPGGRFSIEPVRVALSTSKAQNVNAVVGRVRGRFVGIFDADHHPHSDSLERAWRWLSNGWDIVQGRCSIRNGSDTWVSRMVAIEFEQIYAVSHPGRARFHGFGIFGGSNGFWRTSVLHETRMRHSMLTEDIDSSIRALIAGYRITGDRDLISEELAPTTMQQLLNQRLRWAQGWFQVSFRRVMPALMSSRVSVRQKLGLIHLLVWRELFPWYSIQVVPIIAYWVMVYGWGYLNWTIPIFLATTVFTVSTGPGQVILAYKLAHKPMKRNVGWFFEYVLVSTFFFSPFKDTLSRIAHVKEAMRERAWKVTPRVAPASRRTALKLAATSFAMLLVASAIPAASYAASPSRQRSTGQVIASLLGGEVMTINAARRAAREGRQAEAARLFAQAIDAVPGRRDELLRDYADALLYSGRSAQSVPLYREMLASGRSDIDRNAVMRQLGLALTWSGQPGSALLVYDKLAARNPADTDIEIRRLLTLIAVGRSDDALAALDRIAPAKWASGPLAALGEEALAGIARAKAKAGEAAVANQLLARAIRHNGAKDPALLRAYAEQVDIVRPASAETIPAPPRTPREYRAAIAKMTFGSAVYWQAKRGLAVALSATRAQAEALEAWTTYLKHAPLDADAMIHRGRTLANLGRHDKALESFEAVYARNPKNPVARAGVYDQTVVLARLAARDNHNAASLAFFTRALNLDAGRRYDVLREYADQLSFTGRSVDAVPLYVELLGRPDLPVTGRKPVLSGLANAYAWSGQAKAAAIAYANLATAFPDDVGIRWTRLVFDARDAARNDRNADAVRLFADAIAIAPDRSGGIMREYADQLSFTKQADRAVPLYVALLADPTITVDERFAARSALARAYTWADQRNEAKAAYRQLATDYPALPEFAWNVLVISAREAALTDRNTEAATLFAQAINLDPSRSRGLLAEYADQLSYTGRASNAIGFYGAALAQPDLTETDRLAIKRKLARTLAWSSRFADAAAVLLQLIAQHPQDRALRWDYLLARARQAAKTDDNKAAAKLLAEAIKLMPERRITLLKEYADKLAYSNQAKSAIPLYRELLEKVQSPDMAAISLRDPARSPAAIRSVRLALALALSWDKQQAAALREYRQLADADPDDIEAAIGVARVLSWSGNQPGAIAAYRRVLDRRPDSAEAGRGLAQAQDWAGQPREAQATLKQLVRRDPTDFEARKLLAQSLANSGLPDRAIKEVREALQLRVELERRPAGRSPTLLAQTPSSGGSTGPDVLREIAQSPAP